MKKNVLHVVYSLGVGGAEKMILNYVSHLNFEKYNNFVCAIKKEGPIALKLRLKGTKVFCLHKNSRYQLTALIKLLWIIKKYKIDILHAHNPSGSIWGVPAAILGGVRLIVRTEHTIYIPNRVSILYPFIDNLLNIFTDFIICCSNEVLKTHLEKKKVFQKKYVVIHNGIDGEAYKATYGRYKIKKELGIPIKNFVIGSVGNLTEPKGYEYLIQAFKIISTRIGNVVLLLVGEGELRSYLEHISDKLNLSDHIMFLGLRNDVPNILNVFDVYVSSSTREGLSIALLEAMAARRPIVVTDIGGNREAITDGYTGLVVPTRKSDILAEKILLLLKNSSLRNQLALNASIYFQNNFNIQKTVRMTEKIYDTCRD